MIKSVSTKLRDLFTALREKIQRHQSLRKVSCSWNNIGLEFLTGSGGLCVRGSSEFPFGHEAFRIGERSEAEFGVNAVGVLCREEPVAGGEFGMIQRGLNEVAREALAAVRSVDPNVAEIGEAGAVGDDAKGGGSCAVVDGAEDERRVCGGER